MRIALYIEDGLEQIVLTPDSKVERDILAKMLDEKRDMSIKRGSFYGCQGGWIRWKQQNSYQRQSSMFGGGIEEDESLMIVLKEKEAVA